MEASDPLITLSNVTRSYQTEGVEVNALKSVSLHINQGEFVAIMGQSGSGKSTLMNILGCLDKPTSGDYCIHGQPVAELSNDQLAALRLKTFGFVFFVAWWQEFRHRSRTSPFVKSLGRLFLRPAGRLKQRFSGARNLTCLRLRCLRPDQAIALATNIW